MKQVEAWLSTRGRQISHKLWRIYPYDRLLKLLTFENIAWIHDGTKIVFEYDFEGDLNIVDKSIQKEFDIIYGNVQSGRV